VFANNKARMYQANKHIIFLFLHKRMAAEIPDTFKAAITEQGLLLLLASKRLI
jgi:hypothetical protein